MRRSFALLLPLTLLACGSPALQEQGSLPAGEWTLQPDQSSLSFVSVKAGNIGEAHRFATVKGRVGEDGKAALTIDLASVETGIDIRDQRMRDMLFDVMQFPNATATTSIDPAAFKDLKPGARRMMDAAVTLDLHGVSAELPAKLIVTRVAADRVLVETARPVVVDAEAFGLADGVEQLRSVANLSAISHAVPVSVSLLFQNAR